MYERYIFFKEQGKKFFDTHESLAEYLNTPVRTLTRRLSEMEEIGILKKSYIKLDRHVGFQKSIAYEVADIFTDARYTFGNQKIERTRSKTKNTPIVNKYQPDDDPNCPF